MKTLSFILVAIALAKADVRKVLTDGSDKFTSQFLTEVIKQRPDTSVVLSAFSVFPLLGQLAFASSGQTHDEILSALGLPNDNVTIAVFSEVNHDLSSVKGIELDLANKIYIREGDEISEEFATVSEELFGSEVEGVNFADNVATAANINAWVEDHTNKKIKNLVDADSLDAGTDSVMVNAIYFKGAWQNPFSEYRTKDRDFHVSKEKKTQLPIMYKDDVFSYFDSAELNAQFIEIPYEDNEATFLIGVPKEIDGLGALLEKLKDPKALDHVRQQMHNITVDLFLPKFTIETTTDLKVALNNMKVRKVFNSDSQIDRLFLSSKTVQIQGAVQKAVIEVNEKGSEAAAANSLIMATSLVIGAPVVKADRPFYFEINRNGVTLFNGVFRGPSSV